VFTLCALDVARLRANGPFRGVEVLNAMNGPMLDEAKLTGVCSRDPDVPV
jgi:phosphatidylethanolamine-binding protein (PEBP) family uncharacterized protein